MAGVSGLATAWAALVMVAIPLQVALVAVEAHGARSHRATAVGAAVHIRVLVAVAVEIIFLTDLMGVQVIRLPQVQVKVTPEV